MESEADRTAKNDNHTIVEKAIADARVAQSQLPSHFGPPKYVTAACARVVRALPGMFENAAHCPRLLFPAAPLRAHS